MTANDFINHFYKFLLFIAAMSILNDPTLAGEWKAEMDIGYDMIWSEYLMDYTCDEEN